VLRRVAFHAIFIAGVTQIKSASNALYLARREPEGLALLYIAVAVTVAVASFALSRGLIYRRPLALLRRYGVVLAAVMIAFGVVARFDLPHVFGLIYVVGELYATGLSVLFWADASERFDMRAQKRIVGLLAAGGMLGAIVGGALVRPLAALIGVELLLALAGATLLLAIPLMGGGYAERRKRPRNVGGGRFNLGVLLWQRYPRRVALLVGALAVLATLVDFHFRVTAAAQLNEAELAALFGDLNAAVGVIGIGFQTFLTTRLLASFGVFVFLGLVPAAVGALAVGAMFTSLFALVVVLKGVEMAGSYSLYQPGQQLLYNPLAIEQRHALRPLIDGATKKLGVALGGLGLIALAALGAQAVVLPAIVVCVVMIMLLLHLVRSGYVATLDARLGERHQRVHVEIDPADKVTQQALVRTLRSDNGRQVLTALTVLERLPDFDLGPYFKHLLVHNSETVRVAAIERARGLSDPQVIEALRAILETDARRPRARAARTLAALDPANASTALRPYLHDADPGVRVAVVEALLPLEQEGEGPAHAVLGTLVSALDHPPPVRRELAKLLGELGDGPFVPRLAELLHDDDPSVQRLACRSASRIHSPRLVDDLVELLADRDVRVRARDALVAQGDDVVELLEALLNDLDAPLIQRLQVPRVLRAIGTRQAAQALLFSRIRDNATLRYRIATALFEMTRAHPDLEVDRQRTDEAALRRLRAYRHYRPILRTLEQAPEPAYAPLARAVGDRLSQNLEMGLRLIGLARDPDMMLRIFEGIDKRGSSLRAEAIELIDVALAGDPMRAELLRHIEDETLPGSTPEEEVHALLGSRDPLLRGLAGVVAERLGLVDARPDRHDLIDVEGESMERPFIERLLLLENVDLFAKLSMDDLAAMTAITDERDLEPGAIIYREGEAGDAMFVIVSGQVELLKGNSAILRLGAGESIGQVSLMDGGPRPVTARVLAGEEGARFLVIQRAAFMDLLSDRFELVTGLFAVLAQRLRKLIELTGDRKAVADPGQGRDWTHH
jgi:HEAT repeat protein